MAVVAIDPGMRHTGLVHMEGWHVLDAKTIAFRKGVGQDNLLARERAGEIAQEVTAWLASHDHACVVLEGFTGFTSRQGVYAWQTPFLVGYLLRELATESVALQTSRQVLNPRSTGNVARYANAMAEGRDPFESGGKLITNEHLRSAAAHGIYYYQRERRHV